MSEQFSQFAWISPDGPVTKIHELIRELRVTRIMTEQVQTLPQDATMHDVKEVLREGKISGLPIVDGEKMVGVVSVEDLVRAMEEDALDVSVTQFMTHENLIICHYQEPLIEALRRLESSGVGRLPVVDCDGKLVGIITRSDVMAALMDALQKVYNEVETLRAQPRYFFEALHSDNTSLILRYSVVKGDYTHGGEASAQLKRGLLRIGASPKLARRVAIATYEAEMNLVIHTNAGGHIIAEVRPDQITVVAQDSGPGIPDVELARQPGYSTASSEVRAMGFGAGMGLVNIDRCSDAMDIWSAMTLGTRVQMTFYVPPEEADR
ncbi:MAG: CBS domain-containing protein [Anaerolineae bacterium]|nr:CBS domain-containing protein [Anaerolineae bacterium]